jgi:hypothetical protein
LRQQSLAPLGLKPGFVVVEAEAPHDVAVYHLDEEQIYMARETIAELLTRVAECERTGIWPGIAPEPQPLLLPRWEYAGDDADADGLGLNLDGVERAA